jgi:hypothetical protein
MGRFPWQIVAAVHNTMLVTVNEHRGVVRIAAPRSCGCNIFARSSADGGIGRLCWVAEQPAHVCVNEITISPTWNRIYIGAPDMKQR